MLRGALIGHGGFDKKKAEPSNDPALASSEENLLRTKGLWRVEVDDLKRLRIIRPFQLYIVSL